MPGSRCETLLRLNSTRKELIQYLKSYISGGTYEYHDPTLSVHDVKMIIEALEKVERMTDQEALRILNETPIESVEQFFAITKAIKALEQKPKTGYWININKDKWNAIPIYTCSACGAKPDLRDWSGKSPFCPWCGAKMILKNY